MTDQPAKRALIVDDSKSARGFLARILQKHGIEVDTAENAEQAIDYLAHTQPDVIFMDHLMPGMDGFQAVQSIKNNPRTATIPIMMYTSQEGELYLGQARALGAVGVLPKQVKPAEVSTVLYQLRVLPDRRRNGPSGFQPGNVAAERALVGAAPPAAGSGVATAASAESGGGAEGLRADATGTHAAVATAAQDGELAAATTAALAAGTSAPGEPLRPLVEDAVRAQLTEFRRAIAAYLDQNSDRLLADVRSSVAEVLADASAAAAPPPRPPSIAPWWLAAGASVLAAILAVLWLQETRTTQDLAAQLVVARAAPPLVAPGAVPDVGVPLAANSAAAAAASPVTPQATAAAAGKPAAASAREIVMQVPYGEIPVSGERLESLRRLLEDLQAGGFRGHVTVTSFPGRFCLSGTPTEGFAPAAADLPVDKCDLVGNPFDDNLAPAQREPVALANLIGALRQRSGGALQVELAAGAETLHASAYPGPSPALRASEWNRAAEGNNRLEIRIQPDAT